MLATLAILMVCSKTVKPNLCLLVNIIMCELQANIMKSEIRFNNKFIYTLFAGDFNIWSFNYSTRVSYTWA